MIEWKKKKSSVRVKKLKCYRKKIKWLMTEGILGLSFFFNVQYCSKIKMEKNLQHM